MPTAWLLVLVQIAAPPATVEAPPVEAPPVVAPPVAPPMPPIYMPPPYPYRPYGPPDFEALDRQYGGAYLEPKGTGLRISGGITLAFGAPLLLASLACGITGAALSDAGQTEDARLLLYTAAGVGLAGVLGTGGGLAMLIVGKARKRRYHEWLLQRAGLRLAWRAGAVVGPQRVGLGLTLRF